MTYTICFIIEVFAGVMYPAQQTLYYLEKVNEDKKYFKNLNYWVAYWVLLGAISLVYHLTYFFPFAYEIKVILTLALSHPNIDAPQLFITFVVKNPRARIQFLKTKKKLKDVLELIIFPKMRDLKIFN